MTARQIAADGEQGDRRRGHQHQQGERTEGGKDQEDRHGSLTASYLYIVKIDLEAGKEVVKRNLYSVKIRRLMRLIVKYFQ